MAPRAGRDDAPQGLLLVDKPEGPTSFDVVAKLRRALQTREIGHAGTLDPLATGLLVVLVGTYTRLSAILTADDKEYTGTIRFGTRTTTDDREGGVVESGDASGLDEATVRAALRAMTGPLSQVPPIYSAIHVGGERLYDKARRGEDVAPPAPRDVVVRAADLLSWSSPIDDGQPRTPPADTLSSATAGQAPRMFADAVVRVWSSKGFYVRAYARDVGAHVGVPSHLAALRRTRSGAYSVEDAAPLSALLEDGVARARLTTGPAAIRGVPLVAIDDAAAKELRHGRRVPGAFGLEGKVGVAHTGGALVALVEERDGALRVVRGL